MESRGKIILSGCFGPAVKSIFVQPAPDPKTGMLPKHVKRVDSKGDMLLTEAERNSSEIFIKETEVFELYHGITFNLDNPKEAAIWYAIQFNPAIALSRDERDENGNLKIDGTATRNGRGQMYVYNPGEQTRQNVSKTILRHKAESYVVNDDIDHKRNICKLLGRNMNAFAEADVTEFLLECAMRTPQRIIDMYTGTDSALKIMIFDALSVGIIKKDGGIYTYADNCLGGSQDSVVEWCKMPQNAGLLKAIKQDVYPNIYTAGEISDSNNYEDTESEQSDVIVPKRTYDKSKKVYDKKKID